MNRTAEINSLDKTKFRAIIHEICPSPQFARLFNRTATGISNEDKKFLKDVLISGGLKAPIEDLELDEICAAISGRSICIK